MRNKGRLTLVLSTTVGLLLGAGVANLVNGGEHSDPQLGEIEIAKFSISGICSARVHSGSQDVVLFIQESLAGEVMISDDTYIQASGCRIAYNGKEYKDKVIIK